MFVKNLPQGNIVKILDREIITGTIRVEEEETTGITENLERKDFEMTFNVKVV
jgi:hypothetical protein